MRKLLICSLFCLIIISGCTPVIKEDLQSRELEMQHSELSLKESYRRFYESLDHVRIEKEYPKAVKLLESKVPVEQEIGLRVLAASEDVDAVYFIVPLLDAENARVRVMAGYALETIVSNQVLKNRDSSRPDRIVILPQKSGERDLKPIRYIVEKMLDTDEPNIQSYAATMTGYLRIMELELVLRKLLNSEHPAVNNSAKYALELMGKSTPALEKIYPK